VAAAFRTDPDHERCAAFFERAAGPLIEPELVVGEAAYLV
jgi:hypothetical protein